MYTPRAPRPLVLGLFFTFAFALGSALALLDAPEPVPSDVSDVVQPAAAPEMDAYPPDPAVPPSSPAPTSAPDFVLETLGGETFRLSEQEGRVVVVNFWATWCPPCREEIPDFIQLQEEFGAEDVVFVGVSLDDAGPDRVRAFAEDFGVNYPIVIDDGSASAAYGPIASLPTTFLIGPDGTVQGYAPGMVTREMIEPPIANLVAGRPVNAGADPHDH